MKYLKQWQIESESKPGKYYTVSLDDNGNYSCSCPQWIYRHKECKHIRTAQSLITIADNYLYNLIRWRRAVLQNHINNVWETLYKKAQKVDIELTAVTLKIGVDSTPINEIQNSSIYAKQYSELREAVFSLHLPFVAMRLRLQEPVVNLLELSMLKEGNEPLISFEKIFKEEKDYKLTSNSITLSGKHDKRNGNYVPAFSIMGVGDYCALTPTIGVVRPEKR